MEDRTIRITIRQPRDTDGAAIYRLISQCPPLDLNSPYCYLLLCTHFAGTSAIAEGDGQVVGFLSGYRPPGDPETLFVWQVAVAAPARGQGLGKRLLLEIFSRPECRQLRYLQTTITRDNEASWALFNGFGDLFEAPREQHPLFQRETHFGGQHDTEFLLTIGPMDTSRIETQRESTE